MNNPNPADSRASVAEATAAATVALDAASASPRSAYPGAVAEYAALKERVRGALGAQGALSSETKVALALEVLRARQLEVELQRVRDNIEALVRRADKVPRSVRCVTPASAVAGLPRGVPLRVRRGKLLLTPSPEDPTAMFLTLEMLQYGSGVDENEDR